MFEIDEKTGLFPQNKLLFSTHLQQIHGEHEIREFRETSEENEKVIKKISDNFLQAFSLFPLHNRNIKKNSRPISNTQSSTIKRGEYIHEKDFFFFNKKIVKRQTKKAGFSQRQTRQFFTGKRLRDQLRQCLLPRSKQKSGNGMVGALRDKTPSGSTTPAHTSCSGRASHLKWQTKQRKNSMTASEKRFKQIDDWIEWIIQSNN